MRAQPLDVAAGAGVGASLDFDSLDFDSLAFDSLAFDSLGLDSDALAVSDALPSDDLLSPLALPTGVVADDDFLLSVMYQPEPLKMMPAGCITFFNVA
ncbi:MAG: hypothetical protein ABI874_11380 [Chloroflexota bacterium]